MNKHAKLLFAFIIIVIIVFGFFLVQKAGKNGRIDESFPQQQRDSTMDTQTQSDQQKQPPPMQLDTGTAYTAVLKTSEGDITINLQARETPITVNNFIYLSREGLYDDTIFHRVVEGFMIQGGDPKGDGTGNPGYTFDDEPFEGDYSRGTVAMANSGPNTNGSQFFIVQRDVSLPKDYVIFGTVTAGMEVVDEIASAQVTSSASGESSKPVSPVTVESVQILTEQTGE